MDIRKVHILVEQGLQQVGVFAYDDFEPEEIDLQVDAAVYKILKSAFHPERPNNQFQYNQGVLDRIRVLQETDILGQGIDNPSEDYIEVKLPEDYLDLVRSSSLIEKGWCCSNDPCLHIKEGKFYKVLSGAIIYDSIEYREGEVFKGVVNRNIFTELPSEDKIKVVEFKPLRKHNRLIESARVYEVLDNSLSTTSINSPVSELTKDSIRVYYSNFIVNNILISYIRLPSPVNFNFKRFSYSDQLTVGKKYEVLKTPVTYGGISYNLRDSFIADSSTSFVGTGQIKEFLDGDLNLPEQVCYDVIHEAVQKLAIISEQDQQKINNLIVKDNVPS